MSSLPERVRFARVLGHLSARQLGLLVGKSPQWASALERGELAEPSAAALCEVGRVLGTTVEWLVLGVGEAPTGPSVRSAVARAKVAS